MISKALVKYIRISPRKTREVIHLVNGRHVNEALAILKNTNKRAARVLIKLLNSAIANTNRIPNMRHEDLYISKLSADGGPFLKRYMAQAQGRATMIKKRTSHIKIELALSQPKKPAPAEVAEPRRGKRRTAVKVTKDAEPAKKGKSTKEKKPKKVSKAKKDGSKK